ncbi:MAG: redoxin domain-containing protein [Pyrinomonadaceae bacterium]
MLLIRILLAGIFALAGIAKFLDLKGSRKAFMDFGIPQGLAMPGAIALSIVEIVIAGLFLSIETSWYAAIGASFLLLLFIIQMIYQMARGNAPDCHCFGQIHSEPVSTTSVVRNIIFAVPAILLVVRGENNQGYSLLDPRVDLIQLVFGTIVVALLFAAIFTLRKISNQQTEIMRRIELMELVARDGAHVERDDVVSPHDGLPIGAVVTDFELPGVDGKVVSLSDLRFSGKPVLFFYVSPSCSPCRALVPEFETWQRELGDKLQIVFLSSGSPDENIEKFGGESEKTILLQKHREVADLLKAQWTPTAVLVNANGRIASHAAAGDSAIRELVESIADEDLSSEFAHFVPSHNGHTHARTDKIGSTVPEISVADVGGRQITSEFFKGRPTLVTFWSTGCPHCTNMLESLREWDAEKGADAPNLILFSDDESENFGLDSPVVYDPGHKTASDFGMFGTPSAVLIDEKGRFATETAVGAPDIWSLVGKRK